MPNRRRVWTDRRDQKVHTLHNGMTERSRFGSHVRWFDVAFARQSVT